jgi:hypothetical protein
MGVRISWLIVARKLDFRRAVGGGEVVGLRLALGDVRGRPDVALVGADRPEARDAAHGDPPRAAVGRDEAGLGFVRPPLREREARFGEQMLAVLRVHRAPEAPRRGGAGRHQPVPGGIQVREAAVGVAHPDRHGRVFGEGAEALLALAQRALGTVAIARAPIALGGDPG